MARWQREEAEEEAWLKEGEAAEIAKGEQARRRRKLREDDEGRRQRRMEYLRLRKQRKKRLEMKKKMQKAKRLREMAFPRGKVRGGCIQSPIPLQSAGALDAQDQRCLLAC